MWRECLTDEVLFRASLESRLSRDSEIRSESMNGPFSFPFQDPNALPVAVAALVGFLTLALLLFFVFGRRRVSRRTVMLAGTCEAGKTALFAQVVHGKPVETYTSAKENTGEAGYAYAVLCLGISIVIAFLNLLFKMFSVI